MPLPLQPTACRRVSQGSGGRPVGLLPAAAPCKLFSSHEPARRQRVQQSLPRRPTSAQCLQRQAEGAVAAEDLFCSHQSIPNQPYVSLQLPDHAETHVFGLCHIAAGNEAAEWIWCTRPAVVVVETAINAQHGEACGQVLCLEPEARAADFRLRMLCQLAAQLDTSVPPTDSSMWQSLKQQFDQEQLCYIAALAVGSQLVFGDRPKQITYQRLLNQPRLADLDAAFGALSTANMNQLLASHGVPLPEQPLASHCVHRIMTHERDIVMAHSLKRVGAAVGPSATVVGIVGEAHVAGICEIFASGIWRSESKTQLLFDGGTPPTESATAAGFRRALLNACLGLCCDWQVIQDFESQMGPVPKPQQAAHDAALELYGSARMLLAVLSQDDLASVCGGYGCDMWDVLAPLRCVRPLNGGPGFDEQLLDDLRAFAFIDVI